jgi:FtsP/CotA-like multicopper oxidase with cupredoxin domain
MMSRHFVALTFALASLAGAGAAQASPLAHMPEVRSQNGIAQLTLTAVQNPKTGLPAFSFDGGLVPPTIRVNPGDRIELLYVNALPTPVHQSFTNMTNLHFHGLKTSPHAPGDDTITIMIMPGQSYQYVVAIPKDESPGLYWYHTHPCGETNRQASGGMSGLIVVNGIEKYYPAVAHVPERLLIMRDAYPQGEPVPAARRTLAKTQNSAVCTGPGSEVVSLNGTYRPSIGIRPGETQFWRFANASANTFVDIKVDGAQLGVIARDGEPIVFRDPSGRGVFYNDYLVPPAGRVEFFVTGPHYATAKFRTLCVDTGPVGDIAPNRVLADLNTQDPERDALVPGPEALQPTRKPARDIRSFAISDTKTIVFTENKPSGIYMINGQRYDPTKPAHYFARVGTVEAWTVVNETPELHAFHIHQLHFLVYDPQAPAPTGTPLDFQDTVTVPYAKTGAGGKLIPGVVHVLMDFTDPTIKGTFMFHCHIIEHEDGGMMAKIEVLGPDAPAANPVSAFISESIGLLNSIAHPSNATALAIVAHMCGHADPESESARVARYSAASARRSVESSIATTAQ